MKIRLEPETAEEDGQLWVDLVWGDYRLAQGYSDDDTWALLYQGRWIMDVKDIKDAKREIAELEEV